MDGLRSIAKTFWIGGMWVIGLIVTPALFSNLDKVTAGMVVSLSCLPPLPGSDWCVA
ncbi:DUF4149 domain-containing protein [Paludibacterium denitrificans]|uniref:DUF4149 domain-containing protein n=1 Tax=Paludibacterium denitrificans TaxID=2675226 RepID=UPI001E3E56C3|nr:DUF4149 domain-containing protein [Paludibacterium denitrificans]